MNAIQTQIRTGWKSLAIAAAVGFACPAFAPPGFRIAEVIPTLNNTGFMLRSGTEDPYIKIYKALAGDISRSRTILEIGVGGGSITLDALAEIDKNSQTHIYATDIEPRHLDLVWENAQERFGTEGARFVEEHLTTKVNPSTSIWLPPDLVKRKLDTTIALRMLHQRDQDGIDTFFSEAFEQTFEGGEILVTMESARLAFIPQAIRDEYFSGPQDTFLRLPDISVWLEDRSGGRCLATPKSLTTAATKAGYIPVRLASYIIRPDFPVPLRDPDPAHADLRLSVGFFGYKPHQDPRLSRNTCHDLIRLNARAARSNFR